MAKKILIIDDEEQVCLLVKSILERGGEYEVSIAVRGDQGLEKALQEKPDLILLDIVMPGMSGGQVAGRLMEDEKTRLIPVVFMSALVHKQEVETAKGVIGGRPFLAKPVTPQELRDCISKILNSQDN